MLFRSLNKFIANVDFDGVVYVQKIIDAIQSTENVVDVYIDTSTSDQQGVFVAQYDDNNLLVPTQTDGDGVAIGYERKVERFFAPNSGFITQSSQSGAEALLPSWRETIVLKIESE